MKNVFEIDKHRLDEECEGQPIVIHEMVSLQAKMDAALVQAENNLKLVWAEVDQQIRNNPTKFVREGTKLTESLIESLIRLSKRYQQAQTEHVQAVHDAGIARAGVSAAEHKKRMIEKLVELQGRDYFGAPRVKGDGVPKKSSYLEEDGSLPSSKKKKGTVKDF